jgi:hypothetical protein
MKYGRVETSALNGDKWSASRLGHFRDPGTHWIGGWVDPRAGLDAVEKKKKLLLLLGMEPRLCSPSLYRLGHSGSHLHSRLFR